jgi:hypothetical protein
VHILEALEPANKAVFQLLDALDQMPAPIENEALVAGEGTDIYDTVANLRERRC